jgi:hypothetical protein
MVVKIARIGGKGKGKLQIADVRLLIEEAESGLGRCLENGHFWEMGGIRAWKSGLIYLDIA